MPWSNTAMCDAANALRAKYVWAQLHTADSGAAGLNNVSSAGRETFAWTAASSNGDFDVNGDIPFTGGEPSGAVYSVTLWDQDAPGGVFGGQFPLSGDTTFNSAGEYTVTSVIHDGNAT